MLLANLPTEVLLTVLRHCQIQDVVNISLCCRKLHKLSKDPNIWKSLAQKMVLNPLDFKNDYMRMNNMRKKRFHTDIIKFDNSVLCLCVFANYGYVGTRNGYVYRINLETKTKQSVKANSIATSCIAVNSEHLLCGGWDCCISILSLELTKRARFNAEFPVVSLKIKNNTCIYGTTTNIGVFNVDTTERLLIISTPDMVTWLGYHKDLIFAAVDTELYVYDNSLLVSKRKLGDAQITCLSIHRSRIYLASEDNLIREVNFNLQDVHIFRGHTRGVRSLDTFGDFMISGSYDHNLILWDIVNKQAIYTLTGHVDEVNAVGFAGYRIISGGDDRTVHIHYFDSK